MEGRVLRSWVLVMMYLLGGCATTLGAAYQDQMKPETVARWLSWRASEAGRNLDEESLWDQRLAQDVRPKLDLGDAGLARRSWDLSSAMFFVMAHQVKNPICPLRRR